MKSLRESLIERSHKVDVNDLVINEIKEFIKTHYCLCPRYRGVLASGFFEDITDENFDENFKIKRKGSQYTVDSSNVVVFESSSDSLVNDLFVWGKVKSFLIDNQNTLTTLEGSPEEVKGDFCCYWSKFLISLEGAPKKVGKKFSCAGCVNLKNLIGAPEEVGGDFYCNGCINLKNLIGAPEEVGKNFDCSNCHKLESLEGAPREIGKNFDCSNCIHLKSFIGGPEIVGKHFDFSYCTLISSPEGKPKKIGGHYTGPINL